MRKSDVHASEYLQGSYQIKKPFIASNNTENYQVVESLEQVHDFKSVTPTDILNKACMSKSKRARSSVGVYASR